MFYTLHRLVKGLFWMLVLAALGWAWLQREALDPVYVWYDVYRNGGIERTEPLPAVQGKGLGIVDGHTFSMLAGSQVYTVRLSGFDIPQPPFSAGELQREKARRDFLRSCVVSNQAHVEVTYSNVNSLLGVVHSGPTNINIHFLTNHLARFNRAYVKTMPRDVQYRFFSADRARRKWDRALEPLVAGN